jgi:hypothetical protein
MWIQDRIMFKWEVSAVVKNIAGFAAPALVLLFAGFYLPQSASTAQKSLPKKIVARIKPQLNSII